MGQTRLHAVVFYSIAFGIGLECLYHFLITLGILSVILRFVLIGMSSLSLA